MRDLPAPQPGATGFLADLVLGARWADLPQPVRHETKRALVNYLAVCLGARGDRTIGLAVRGLAPFAGPGTACVVGWPQRFDMLTAAMLNAAAANVFDFDDTHIPTILHPSAPVFPALSALAQSRKVDGPAFLLAFLLGVEVECRIANAVSPGHYSRGWHITSTCGVFGAAAAAGRLLGLDRTQLGWALGNASAQASGLVETLGSSAKSLGVGNAARNGLLSACLAQQGFEGPAAPLEGERGFLRIATDTPNPGAITEPTAWGWELLRNTYKPYPCGVVLNPVIDACLQLAGEEAVQASLASPAAIDHVEVAGHPLLRQRTDRPAVSSGRQSQVSAQHAVGVVLRRRAATLAEFSDEAVADEAVRALGAKVRFRDDESMAVDAATVRIVLGDGRSFERAIAAASGSLGNPLTDAQLEDKLRALCAWGGSGVDAAALAGAVWTLDASDDVASMLALASPA